MVSKEKSLFNGLHPSGDFYEDTKSFIKGELRGFLNFYPEIREEIESGLWQVDFMNYNLGYFDTESKVFTPQEDPFSIRLGLRV